jgi:hypothetical protein
MRVSEFRGQPPTQQKAAVAPSMIEARRQAVIYRMLRHRARTQTIIRFTSVSHDRLAALRRRWNIPNETRHRGPSPSSLVQIMRVPRLRAEGAALAALGSMHDAILPVSRETTKDSFFSLANAERLCEVFELFSACIESPTMSFDQFVLLLLSISQKRELHLSQCQQCRACVLIDRLAGPRSRCDNCST